LKQDWQKNPALGPGKQTAKTWFGLEKEIERKLAKLSMPTFT
jgi:hypothetical protein